MYSLVRCIWDKYRHCVVSLAISLRPLAILFVASYEDNFVARYSDEIVASTTIMVAIAS